MNEFELGDSLERLIKIMNRAKTIIDGIVTSVDDDFTCEVTINDVTYSGVPINVLIGNQGDLYLKPKIGSVCLVTFRDGDAQRPQIVQVQEYDEVIFFQGENRGMVLVGKLVDRMNKIEDAYNNLVTKFNGHSHILTLSSGTGTAAPTTDQETTTLTPTQIDDIENTKIIQ